MNESIFRTFSFLHVRLFAVKIPLNMAAHLLILSNHHNFPGNDYILPLG